MSAVVAPPDAAAASDVLGNLGIAGTLHSGPDDDPHGAAAVRAVVHAQRDVLNAMQHRGEIAADVFRVLPEELDWRELSLTPTEARPLEES